MILRIQDEAFRLVFERGYAGTTVEEIAEAADVSPSTVYRTFGTKEGVFLWDELEVPTLEGLEGELAHHSPAEAVAAIVEQIGSVELHVPVAEMRRRARFLYTEPALQCALGEAFGRFERAVTRMLGRRGTVTPTEARILAAAGIAAMREALEGWALSESATDLADVTQAAAASLRRVLRG